MAFLQPRPDGGDPGNPSHEPADPRIIVSTRPQRRSVPEAAGQPRPVRRCPGNPDRTHRAGIPAAHHAPGKADSDQITKTHGVPSGRRASHLRPPGNGSQLARATFLKFMEDIPCQGTRFQPGGTRPHPLPFPLSRLGQIHRSHRPNIPRKPPCSPIYPIRTLDLLAGMR